MKNRRMVDKIKENVLKRTSSDRIMWFSMWFLLSMITFGLALFPMLYLLIERRNEHFRRQKELESLILSVLKNRGVNLEIEGDNFLDRNSLLWAASIVLIVPIFFAAYFLSKDLLLHEKRQMALFRKIFPDEPVIEQKINLKFCMTITLATLGVGIIHWFYKIFNAYNNHFKEQWRIEDKIVELIERGN
ncbi:MAG: hypothetical protein ACQXXG_00600 [Candidatus Bathyarchaeia archaeon]|nr:hypothetical protein [Candidatus Bathyarchaeota archaeon A05DMB-3]